MAFEVQNEAKNNADDLQNYLRELNQWQDEIKIKDDNLRNASKSSCFESVLLKRIIHVVQRIIFDFAFFSAGISHS